MICNKEGLLQSGTRGSQLNLWDGERIRNTARWSMEEVVEFSLESNR